MKEIVLPPEPRVVSEEARAELKKKARAVVEDFVQEVEVCCDLNHPNLVALMGYATKPRLLIVQELLLGQVPTPIVSLCLCRRFAARSVSAAGVF
eukprot:COSAG01_NODE_4272_length_5193_cov_7.742638_4_plen_95_part_00